MADTPELHNHAVRDRNLGAAAISQDLLAYKIDSLVDSVGLLVETIKQLEFSHGGLSRDFEHLRDGLEKANVDIRAIATQINGIGIGEHTKEDLEYLHTIRREHDERSPIIRAAKVAIVSAGTVAICAWLWTAAQNQARMELYRPQQSQVK